MPETYTEVTSKSVFTRFGESIKGIFGGIILVLVAIGLLFWNEGRAVQTAQSLEEGAGAVVSIPADKVDPNNESKLVHLTGQTTVAEQITDKVFGVSASALKLRRQVEMYQWTEKKKSEEKKKVGGGTETVTTYTYDTEWSDRLIPSAQFKHPEGRSNPTAMRFEAGEEVAGTVTVGAFTLSDGLKKSLSMYVPFPVTQEMLASLSPDIRSEFQVYSNSLYNIDANPPKPKVGDIRATFQVVNPGPVSLIAQQSGSSFTPYKTKAGDALEMITSGNVGAAEMFTTAMSQNTMLTWGLRIFGFFLVYIGISMLFAPLQVVADILPIVRDIVAMGLGFVGFMIAAPITLITIGTAWIFYRPMLGGALLVIGIGIIFGGFMAARGSRKPVAVA